MMDVLRPGHAHRSSSDRLLSNYLDSQKHLSQSLLALLSHSHASTSSLLAYTTSSPGVLVPVRKAVRHAGFEGPLSGALLEAHGSQVGSMNGHGQEDAGWHAYITCLDSFRADLKHIHHLEEEVSRVKRDREILVSRLIKSTKSRPSKNDISAIAKEYSQASMSGRESSLSMTSNGSHASKESKRAGKLADAQAELLGCEEHLRSLELKIEHERNNVMMAGLEDRFRAMEAVGQMWIAQAKKGLGDLERGQGQGQGRGHGSDAYELDSNGSIAPSQSASQLGTYEDSPRRSGGYHKSNSKHYRPNGPGSITGSIAEEDESSDDEPRGNLTVHENRPGSTTPRPGSRAAGAGTGGGGAQRSPLGLSTMRAGSYNNNNVAQQGSDSDSSDGNPRRGGRRAASDIGVAGGGLYKPPNSRTRGGLHLHRTQSADRARRPPSPRRRRSGNGSDSSSARGVPVKKKGFFASIGRLFRGSGNKRSSRGSNAGSSIGGGGGGGGGWKTRTDKNLKGWGGGGGGRGGDSSSDDEQGLVAVSNNRNSTWSVDNVGKASGGGGGFGRSTSLGGAGNKRSSNTPIASGLIPAPPNKRQSSQSTITTTTPASRAGARSPTGQAPGIVRSNTMRSTASTATAKTATTVRSAGTAAGTAKKTRPNGSISRTARSDVPATDRNSMMALVNKPAQGQNQGPTMPEVPKAPKSQVTPQLSLPTAPGSSIVRPGDISGLPRSTSTSGAMGKGAQTGAGAGGKPGMTRSTSVGGQSAGAKKRSSTQTQSQSGGVPSTGQNAIYGDDELYPHHSISRSNSVQRVPTVGTNKARTNANRANEQEQAQEEDGHTPAPRPPSRLLAPPLKSALRPSSPSVPSEPLPKIEMFSISAPKPVQVEREQHRASFPAAAQKPAVQRVDSSPTKSVQAQQGQTEKEKERPRPGTRNSFQSMTTDAGESVYESAMEDEGEGDGEGKVRQVTGANIRAQQGQGQGQGDDSSSDEEGYGGEGYDVVDNERVKRLGINIDYDEPHRSVSRGQGKEYRDGEEDSDGTAEPSPVTKRQSQGQPSAPAPAPAKEGSIAGESSVSRRKSVRIRGPDSPTGPVSGANVGTTPLPPTQVHGTPTSGGGGTQDQDGSDGEAGANRQRSQAQWDTRIGRMRDDSSDEEEEEGDDEYKRAKRGLMRNNGDFGGVGAGQDGKGKGKSSGGGSKSGVRRSKSGSSRA